MNLHDVTLSIDNPHKCDTDGTISFEGLCLHCQSKITITVEENGCVGVERCETCLQNREDWVAERVRSGY